MKVEETDNLVVCTSFLDGVSDLESHCLQCDNASIAVRSTNVMGNVTPLAIEWCGGFLLTEEPCNYVAVSSFETSDWGIEIYNMDYCDRIEPALVLGGIKADKKNRGHLGAVLSLAHNRTKPKFIASGGDRGDVVVWDLRDNVVVNEWNGHDGKPIQCLKWNSDGTMLACAGFDRTITIIDEKIMKKRHKTDLIHCRIPDDPEQLCWIDNHHVAVSMSNGQVMIFDMRVPDTPLMEWSASDQEVTGLCTTHYDGLILTASQDGFARVWDITSGIAPEYPLSERDCGHGTPLLCAATVPEEPSYAVFGASELVCWDLACPEYSDEICRWVELQDRKKRVLNN
eukprot:GHVH01007126.1.p1 GENE.GHVH01007126.1~~GHVH01007126.1.p1  ORF type:complete len:341 (+),score=44.54 GHVH01007126.1:304-1326(+)